MNKTELIAAAAEKAGVSKKEAEAVVTAAFDAIAASLKEGEKVQLVGFGSFEVKTRAERIGRNPDLQGRQGAQGHRWLTHLQRSGSPRSFAFCRRHFRERSVSPCVSINTSRSRASSSAAP